MKKRFEDAARPFEPAAPGQSGHIGPGPKPHRKRAVNVSVDAEILKLAKEMKINLSRMMEDALKKVTEAERIRRFQEEFHPAIEAHNRYIEKHGTLTEAYLRELYGTDLYDDDEPSI